jgi:outer membrane protein OmpA-like peptidoglycan-associated protein
MRRFVLLAFAALAAACATGGKLRQNGEVIRADIDKAKRSGAVRCAPKALALAEANVDFAQMEVAYGHATRARQHLDLAETSVKKALEQSRTCGPTQVTIGKKALEPPPPEPEKAKKRIVHIEKTDKDGDGIPDLDDACPDLPGKTEFAGCPDGDGDGIPDAEDACPKEAGPKESQGCPVAKDTDGDGIPDDIDRCPLDPEDKDGFQEEDGCPDPDNDGDGIVDKVDACPNEPGAIENRGCQVTDKDGDGISDGEDRCPDVAGSKQFGGCPDKDGDGVSDGDDRCPDVAGSKQLGGCPDSDGDGIADPDDKCPMNSGPKDNQGCPDIDRDGDTILDRLDKCPEQFGAPPDGCPKKYTLLEVKKERIEIKQQVHFATAKFRVLPDSFPLLDQVVQVLNDFPKMRVSIEGHTDSVGKETFNMRLSQRRAEAVRDYVLSKGIPSDRLEAIGFGPTKPIASNKNERGRAQNRRTEFRIVSLE